VGKTLVTRQDRKRRPQIPGYCAHPGGTTAGTFPGGAADQNDEEFFPPASAKERETMIGYFEKLVQAHGLHKVPTE